MAEASSTGGNGAGQDSPSEQTPLPVAGNSGFIFKETHNHLPTMLQIISETNKHQHVIATGTAEEKLQASKAMKSLMLNAASSVEVEPWMVDKGVETFLRFDEELTLADAVQLASELQVAKPGTMEIRPEVILRLHEVIRSEKGLSQDPKAKQTLRVFLNIILNKAQTQSIPDDTDEAVAAIGGLLLSVSMAAYENMCREKPAKLTKARLSAMSVSEIVAVGFQISADMVQVASTNELVGLELHDHALAGVATLSELLGEAAKCTDAAGSRAICEKIDNLPKP